MEKITGPNEGTIGIIYKPEKVKMLFQISDIFFVFSVNVFIPMIYN